MTDEWRVNCKDCGKELGYSDWSYQQGAARGQSRPERCPECRKRHNSQTGTMGLAYFDLKPRVSVDTSKIHAGGLGALSHPMREHQVVQRPSNFDPSKFGITDDDVRKLFNWLREPNHQVAVVVGPTGSGKSTVLPYRLISPPDGVPADQFTRYGQIVITQPRIQATRNIPAYVAQDLYGSSIGSGFDIGFRYSNHPYSDWRNRLVYVTDGTLINWIVNGQIANLSTIMIDEAHERSLNIDLILGMLKKLLPRYPHLKLIIASATIDSGLFLGYFGCEEGALIEFQGMRKFNVETYYRSEDNPEDKPLPYDDVVKLRKVIPDEVARKVFWLLQKMSAGDKEPGDILGFLQGERPIEQAVATLRQLIKGDEKLAGTVDVFPLYTTLPQEEQDKALKEKPDPNRRRVVITTNVAETSLTVEGVVYVVDSGLINEAQWDPESQTKQIVTIPHSRAGCKQRWGRGGRVRDGQAYCLYTKEQFETIFLPYTVPQIQRSPLEQVVLNAKAAGIDDVAQFDWIQKPPEKELERAPRVLRDLGALDELNDLTPLGVDLQTFADEPTLAKVMVMADRFACAIEMATVLPMMKMGGHRYILRWDTKWDATTRRAVNRIHRALMKGCLDDIEFCLKLYKAWSETEYYGQLIAPDWAVREVWPRYVPPLSSRMKEILGTDDAKKFRDAAAATPGVDNLRDLVQQFGLEEVADDWLTDAQSALLRVGREAWTKAFFINHSIFKNKIEPERELLLDALSGHKKEEERRPINLDLLDRVRIILAYCLTERRYEGHPGPDVHKEGDGSGTESSYAYRPRERVQNEEKSGEQPPIVVQINRDSVCAGRDVDGFVCGKQQVVLRSPSPGEPPAKIMYVSYLSLVKPEWWEWLEERGHSPTALGQFISAQTREEATGELISTYAYERLFLDQIVPIGSRHQCQVMDIHADGAVQLAFVRRLSDARKVQEDFKGDEPTITEVVDTVDEVDVEAGDLVDTVLNLDEAVLNIEEDEEPPWVALADDTWEVEVATPSVNSSLANSERAIAATEQTSLEEQHDRSSEDHPMGSTGSDHSEEDIISDWPDRPVGYLQSAIRTCQRGDVLAVEVVDYDYDNPALPKVIVQLVPDPEPFDVFMGQYRNRIGDTITVVATAYDERPGDSLVSLVVREPVSGLEMLLEPDQLSFTIRGLLLKEIPLGSELQAVIEHIDEERERASLSCLPVVEAHLNEVLQQQRSRNGRYEVEAVVGMVAQERVFLTLGWSEPALGLLHIVSVGGRGLYKPAAAYQIGETCQVRLWFADQDRPSRKGLDELPEEIKSIIDAQRKFQNLYWESGILQYSGRMSHSLRDELQAPTRDKNYRRAIETLYRFSNQFIAETIDTDWCQRIGSKYPVGTYIPEARVLNLASFGAFVELELGVSGLVHKSEMSWGGNENPEDIVTVDQRVEVRVIKVDCERQTIGLSMKMPGKEPAPKYRVGDRVRGKVTSVQNYGAFVELEPGVNGLVHKSEMWGNVFDATKAISVGAEMDVLIMSMESGKMSLSMKKIPENNPLLKYHAGDRARGRVTEVKDFGAFVELEPGVNGLIHKSKMGGFVPDARRVVTVGEEVNVLVLTVDMQRQNLSLSM